MAVRAAKRAEGRRTPDHGIVLGNYDGCIEIRQAYLHYVLDEWFVSEVLPRMAGKAYLIRYADDFVIGFTDQLDAKRVMDVLPKRFAKYGLTLHPTKTRLVRFHQPNDQDKGSGQPESFDLLGFTHYWGRSKRGEWVVRRKTASKRLRRAVQGIHQWCRANRHQPLAEQQRVLSQKLRGHCAYYGITGNGNALTAFRTWMQRAWRYWLNRRNREHAMPWEKFERLLARYPLPAAVAIHSLWRRTANP